jgi:CheY-like chemotaxis protein
MSDSIFCFLVDDDTDDQEIFALAIRETGYNVTCGFAKDGVEAIEKLSSIDPVPHFIFLDLNMPRMNGIQCLKELRKMEVLASVPVIIYSTSSDQRDINETKRLGATDYLIKPSSIRDLTGKLLSILANKER